MATVCDMVNEIIHEIELVKRNFTENIVIAPETPNYVVVDIKERIDKIKDNADNIKKILYEHVGHCEMY